MINIYVFWNKKLKINNYIKLKLLQYYPIGDVYKWVFLLHNVSHKLKMIWFIKVIYNKTFGSKVLVIVLIFKGNAQLHQEMMRMD